LREGAASAYLIIAAGRKKSNRFRLLVLQIQLTRELTLHKYYSIKNRKSKALTLLLSAAFLTCFASHDKKAD
jgi:hypothetical protein